MKENEKAMTKNRDKDIKNNNNEKENNKKRKNNNKDVGPDFEAEENDMLALSLNSNRPQSRPRLMPSVDTQLPASLPLPVPPQSSPSLSVQPTPLFIQTLMPQKHSSHPLQLSSSHPLYMTKLQSSSSPSMPLPNPGVPTSRHLRARRNPTQGPREGKSETVPAPFPWATTRRAMVHSLEYLHSRQIVTITGEVQCKRCERQYEMDYNLKEKFLEVGSFIAGNKSMMRDRAPSVWMNPVLPACKFCKQENSAKPIIGDKKKVINWLFLLLGQMLGCCTLEQLKYFCKHTKNHRTGAKDRVLYLTYLGLCKQLDPNGPFDR
ncbi:hypothetical protein ACFX13_003083 [Malus domestica]|uniref:uncharacterized protein n=1 Tax=Malus domestica TaxID=3750 RepID=UPI0039762627